MINNNTCRPEPSPAAEQLCPLPNVGVILAATRREPGDCSTGAATSPSTLVHADGADRGHHRPRPRTEPQRVTLLPSARANGLSHYVSDGSTAAAALTQLCDYGSG
jgi:hypothetical protein